MARRTRSSVSGSTKRVALMTCDTVVVETPALCATSRIVGIRALPLYLSMCWPRNGLRNRLLRYIGCAITLSSGRIPPYPPLARCYALPYDQCDDYYDYCDQIVEGMMATQIDTWTVAEAKARFSELIDRALADGPQTITRHGKEAVVVVAAPEWERKTKRTGNLAEFFAASPLRDSGLTVERPADGPRESAL